MPVTKFTKARWAEEALVAYATCFSHEPVTDIKIRADELIADLLVDLQHYCEVRGYHFNTLVADALEQYQIEKLIEEKP